MGTSSAEDFSVVVLASDLGVDARPFLNQAPSDDENWQDCPSHLPAVLQNQDFTDLDALGFFRLEQGSDNLGNRIFRIVGKYFPASVIPGEILKGYVLHKIISEMPEGPFCIVYMHSNVQSEDNSPGIMVLRWIYEDLPDECKERLQVVYFLHPGLRSRLVLATLGRLFLSGGLYQKIKHVSRLQYLWQDIKKGEIEIPEFVKEHDDILEHRPLTDYGIEPNHLHLMDFPSTGNSFYRYQSEWKSTGDQY